MNTLPLSGPAREVIELIQSSEVFRSMVENHPDLRALLIQAAEVAAKTSSDRKLFLEAVAHAAHTSDRAVEVMFSGDSADLAERVLLSERANEDLGRLLKRLCPMAVPIGIAASMAPN